MTSCTIVRQGSIDFSTAQPGSKGARSQLYCFQNTALLLSKVTDVKRCIASTLMQKMEQSSPWSTGGPAALGPVAVEQMIKHEGGVGDAESH